MPDTGHKRDQLLEAARTLIHQQGFRNTTLADIARVSGVPLGNVYYYFKSKDDICAAVIDEQCRAFAEMAQDIQQLADPRQRLGAYLDYIGGHSTVMARYGCPVGSLTQELNKEQTGLRARSEALIRQQLDWMAAQLESLGVEDAAARGFELLATLQGTALLANTLHDPELVARQVRRSRDWLASL